MKSTLTCRRQPFGIVVLLFAMPIWLVAAEQDRGETPDEQPHVPTFRQLPSPLDGISGNILDLEKSEHFQIVDAQIGRTRQFEQEALIWTVAVRRAILCAHAQVLLRYLADARFYRIEKDAQWRKQVQITRLYYPNWIDSGAAHGETIPRDERFEIWIPLTAAEWARLQQQRANRLVLSHPDRRTVLPETTKRSKPFSSWKAR